MACASATPAAAAWTPRSRKLPWRSVTRRPKRARRRRARSSASGSPSIPSRRVVASPASNSRSACPPIPIVPSTTQPPRRGRKRNVSSSTSTGRCAASSRSLTLHAQLAQLLPQLVERRDGLALEARVALCVPHLEALHHADDDHVSLQPRALAIILRDLDAPIAVELHVEPAGNVAVKKMASERALRRQRFHARLEILELAEGMHVEGIAGRHDDELRVLALREQIPEFGRNADAPLGVDRVPEMSSKHIPSLRGKLPPELTLDDTSWDFIPLSGVS